MSVGKQNISFLVGEIYQSESGVLHGRVNGQKVFLKEVVDRDGRKKWLVNQQIEGFLTDPKPRQNASQGATDFDFHG